MTSSRSAATTSRSCPARASCSRTFRWSSSKRRNPSWPWTRRGTRSCANSSISQHKVFHGGTYNTNPVSMAAGLATFREVLTRENYAKVDKLGKKLADGYRATIAKVGLQAYIADAGANGALMLYPKEIVNYRDWE